MELDLLLSEDPANYAPYELVTDNYGYDLIYIIRLMSSVTLWKRVAERLWWRANRLKAIPAFEIFRLLRESFLQKMNNEQVVSVKIHYIAYAVMYILCDGGLLEGVIEDICLVDEQSMKEFIRTSGAERQVETLYLNDGANEMNRPCIDGKQNRGAQLARWIHYCHDLWTTGGVGTDVGAKCGYRWFSEDWPRPRNIFPGNPVHWEDGPSPTDQLTSLVLPRIVDPVYDDFLTQFQPMRNDRGSKEKRQDLRKAAGTRYNHTKLFRGVSFR